MAGGLIQKGGPAAQALSEKEDHNMGLKVCSNLFPASQLMTLEFLSFFPSEDTGTMVHPYLMRIN